MAAGFAMLESGLVRAKNTTEILTKNIALYAIMYDGAILLSGIGQTDTASVLTDFAGREDGFEGAAIYSTAADFFFQVVFVATAMSIVSGAVAERMKLWAFLAFAVVMTSVIYPLEGSWTWGSKDVFGLYNLGDLGFSDFAGSGRCSFTGRS
jgi:Amt family ammonium transporter